FSQAPGQREELTRRLRLGSNKVEDVAVLTDALEAPRNGLLRDYGERTEFQIGPLRYPDMTLALVSRTEAPSTNPDESNTNCRFIAFGRTSQVSFSFDTRTL